MESRQAPVGASVTTVVDGAAVGAGVGVASFASGVGLSVAGVAARHVPHVARQASSAVTPSSLVLSASQRLPALTCFCTDLKTVSQGRSAKRLADSGRTSRRRETTHAIARALLAANLVRHKARRQQASALRTLS